MKRNTKIALVMMALSAMAMGSTSAFAHGGHGMWQQNAAPLTSEQQTAWQKIHNDFYAQSSALQQQLVTKRYEYNALLAANPPDKAPEGSQLLLVANSDFCRWQPNEKTF